MGTRVRVAEGLQIERKIHREVLLSSPNLPGNGGSRMSEDTLEPLHVVD